MDPLQNQDQPRGRGERGSGFHSPHEVMQKPSPLLSTNRFKRCTIRNTGTFKPGLGFGPRPRSDPSDPENISPGFPGEMLSLFYCKHQAPGLAALSYGGICLLA